MRLVNGLHVVFTLGVFGIIGGGCGTSSSSGNLNPTAGEQQCRSSTECTATNDCKTFTPLRPLCGGHCETAVPAFGCHADADCADAGANAICGALCICPRDGLIHPPHCIPGCGASTDCNPGEICNSMHRCVDAPCVQSSDCPANLACRDPPSGTCAPRRCTGDADCEGYCVSGFCSGTVGVCVDAVSP